jgi:hypothetical protein
VRFLEGPHGAARRAFEDAVHFEVEPGRDQPLLRPDDEIAFRADLQCRIFDFGTDPGQLARAGA